MLRPSAYVDPQPWDLTWDEEKSDSPFVSSPNQAYPDPHCVYVKCRPVERPSAIGLPRVIWREIVEAPQTCLRQKKYSQSINDQREDVHTLTSALIFKENLLGSQVPTWASTLACTSDQFRSSLRLGPKDADESFTPVEGLSQGITTSPSTELQTFAFVKIDLGSSYSFVLSNRSLHSLYIQATGYKDRISSANAETLALRGLTKGTLRRTGLAYP